MASTFIVNQQTPFFNITLAFSTMLVFIMIKRDLACGGRFT